jgi:ATP-dependent Clp protease, protease subunit
MPIGVPRIIYMWGEDLPAQWTDIYNFIFRRRMIFLMQYLDDELCNQICGLLINIHMEDRSRDLEKKDRSGGVETRMKPRPTESSSAFDRKTTSRRVEQASQRSMDDLLRAEDDLPIRDHHQLEQYTLQKITLDWLNWQAPFFNLMDEPYGFYMAEVLSQDFRPSEAQEWYSSDPAELNRFMQVFKTLTQSRESGIPFKTARPESYQAVNPSAPLEAYAPFRWLAKNLAPEGNLTDMHPWLFSEEASYATVNGDGEQSVNGLSDRTDRTNHPKDFMPGTTAGMPKLLSQLAVGEMTNPLSGRESSPFVKEARETSIQALAQRQWRAGYKQAGDAFTLTQPPRGLASSMQALSYLDVDGGDRSYEQYRDYVRKQTERMMMEEEFKKVFMIINSFGGSVGNGITVHDALQFIRAGALTLGLGVAASAASLALAGGTIGERYVTEACHTMIHQPEGGLQGQASDIWIDSQEIQNIRVQVADIYSISTYRPRHKILHDLDRDFYLTATETIYYGLADEIATNDVMHDIIQMAHQAWTGADAQQQRLMQTRDTGLNGAMDGQTNSELD